MNKKIPAVIVEFSFEVILMHLCKVLPPTLYSGSKWMSVMCMNTPEGDVRMIEER